MAPGMFSGGRVCFGFGLRQELRTTISPTYESALTTNAVGGPAVATMTPPIAGPRVRAMLYDRMFREIAAGRSVRGTCSPTDDCHAGPCNATPQPSRKVRPSRVHSVIDPR